MGRVAFQHGRKLLPCLLFQPHQGRFVQRRKGALGLVPERSLAEPLEREGGRPGWLRLCGNCDYVHEIVDSVTVQAETLGAGLAGALRP